MVEVELTPIGAESGYVERFGEMYTSYLGNAAAKAGTYTRPPVIWRGWLSFDTSGLPDTAVLESARLFIGTVSVEGGAEAWETEFVAADLEPEDLVGSWASDKGSVSVAGGPPSAFDVDLADVIDVLFNNGRTRIAIKLVLLAPEEYGNLEALVSSVRLELTYSFQQYRVSLRSALSGQLDEASALPVTMGLEAGVATAITATSGRADSPDLTSDLTREE